MLSRRIPWMHQPGPGVLVDRMSSLGQGLALALADPLSVEAVSGVPMLASGTITPVITTFGRSASFGNSGSNYLSPSVMPTMVDGAGYTVFAMALLSYASNAVYALTCDDGTTRAFQFRIYQQIPQFIPFDTGGNAFVASGASRPLHVWVPMIGRVFRNNGTNEFSIWVNGSKESEGSFGGTIKAPSRSVIRVGVRLSSGSDGLIGPIALWSRALTNIEIAAVFANPWQVFAP